MLNNKSRFTCILQACKNVSRLHILSSLWIKWKEGKIKSLRSKCNKCCVWTTTDDRRVSGELRARAQQEIVRLELFINIQWKYGRDDWMNNSYQIYIVSNFQAQQRQTWTRERAKQFPFLLLIARISLCNVLKLYIRCPDVRSDTQQQHLNSTQAFGVSALLLLPATSIINSCTTSL